MLALRFGLNTKPSLLMNTLQFHDERHRLTASTAQHLQASSGQLHDHYIGEHGLATFLFLALDA
ncbi:hypothetical protein [Pseudomonas rhodesiae]|uniref:hypothetical protein n=1 Tax=Pseudomonas rhodesiae TaxID=76760 RepID=UPI000FF06965|nr:hypothetical protein [Pseudomonas rhodesiae]ROM50816.1 hypothetical protein BK650_19440 [Pseudomonas rhodesiae]ROM61421.1 hypothetical protein BK651_23410 [Pseudomonas rhodesiae]